MGRSRDTDSRRGLCMRNRRRCFNWSLCRKCGLEEYTWFYSNWVEGYHYIDEWRMCSVCEERLMLVYGVDNGTIGMVEEEEL